MFDTIADMIIAEARDSADIDTVRRLFQAYADALPFSLDFQNFAGELAGLPAPYTPPAGCLLLLWEEDAASGVVALKPLLPGIAEIKRLYVDPRVRGLGAGRMLAERVIAEAYARGYARVRLDSHRASMAAAMSLYRRLGFVEIAPYGPDFGGQLAFFEKRLSA